ncbi:MAG: YCF48-related protein [Ignavibacteriaceae bacterium]|nr:YCF48-related protein [Ignavibacteriaceae bacterium]
MNKFIYFLVIIFLSSSQIKSQWDLVYPDIPTDQINDLIFLDEYKGYCVNKAGDILTTSDGGITWEIIKYYAEQSIEELKFINTLNGFAFASNNIYLNSSEPFIYTTDGGNTWNEAQVSMSDARTFLPISLSQIIKSVYGGIKKLDNFFNNWRYTYNTPTFLAGDSLYQWEELYGDIHQFQKLNSGRILALGSSWNAFNYGIISDSVSFILKSDDSGETWDTLWCDLPYDLVTMSFPTESIGYIAGEDERIYKTSDGGMSWSLVHPSTSSLDINHIFALNEMYVYSVADNKIIFSSDGGNSWQESVISSYGDFKLFFINSQKGFAYGSDLLITTDGGYNWERVSKSIKDDIAKVDFVSPSTGWALSYYSLYKTSDGGYNWFNQLDFYGGYNSVMGIEMLDSLKGFILTPDNIYATNNGGIDWDSIYFGDRIIFYGGVTFLNEYLGIIFGGAEEEIPGSNNYNIQSNFITTNGGITWQKITYPIGSQYAQSQKMKFTDPDHLWSINQKGIWLSKDTAKTWQSVWSTDYFVGGYSFDFIDSLNGILSYSYGGIPITTDGGENWIEYSLTRGIQFRDVQIVGTDIFGRYRIFLAGDRGRVTKFVTDVMPSEQHYPTYTIRKLNDIHLLMQDRLPYLWVAGEGFTILKGNTEIVFNIDEDKNGFIKEFELQQNYPNPFNPTTNIQYAISSRQFVKLTVYDLLGREIETLVNEEKTAGTYEVTWYAGGLPSGVYFYQLRAGEFIETKKMLLLK